MKSRLPEAQHAFLAELLRLDPDATQRFHDRLLELDRRFDLWQIKRYWRSRKRVAWIEHVEVRS